MLYVYTILSLIRTMCMSMVELKGKIFWLKPVKDMQSIVSAVTPYYYENDKISHILWKFLRKLKKLEISKLFSD